MTTQSWVRRRLVVAGVVVLGLMGCTAPGPDDAAPPSTIEHPAPEVPKDRDERAVLAALARIDMCAVLASAAAGTPTTLADPAAARADPRWEACAALGSIPDMDIDGHWPMDRCGTQVFLVAASTAADRPGTLYLLLRKGPVARDPLAAEVVAKAEPVLADIVRKYFS